MNNQLATVSKDMNRVTEEIVRKEPEPAFTDSWHPFSHAKILDAMEIATKESGLKIVNREYSIRPESKMLAAWEIGNGKKDFNFGISILNAIDKTHSVTLGCFEKIFVCSNFCFRLQWERVMFRKHSGNLEIDEVIFLAKEALALLIPKFKKLQEWHESMRSMKITAGQTALITLAAMRRKVVPPVRYEEFQNLLFGANNKYKEYAGSVYAWHGAATELMNNNSLLTITSKQDELNYFLDYEVPLLVKGAGDAQMVDFQKITNSGFEVYKKQIAETKIDAREANKGIRDKFLTQEKEKKDLAKAEKKAKADLSKPEKIEKKKEPSKKGQGVKGSAQGDATKKIAKGSTEKMKKGQKIKGGAPSIDPEKKIEKKRIEVLSKAEVIKKKDQEFRAKKKEIKERMAGKPVPLVGSSPYIISTPIAKSE